MVHCKSVKKKALACILKFRKLTENTPMGIRGVRFNPIRQSGFSLDFRLTRVSKRISSVCQSFLQCLTPLIRHCTVKESYYSWLPHFKVQFLRTERLSDANRKGPSPPLPPSTSSSLPQEVGCVESILQSIGVSIPLGFGKVIDKETSGVTERGESFNPMGGAKEGR